MSRIEVTSASDRTFAVRRDTAKGSKNRTKAGAIKGSFRAAVKAVTRRDPEAPQPKGRKRRGGGADSRVLILRRRPHHVAEPVARGRYARLAVPAAPQNEFGLAAKLLCSIAQDIADIFADLNERLAAVIYGKKAAAAHRAASLGMETPADQSGSFDLSLCNPFGGFEDAGGDPGLEDFDAQVSGVNPISLGL